MTTAKSSYYRRTEQRDEGTSRAIKALKLMLRLETEARATMALGSHTLDPDTVDGAQALADWVRLGMTQREWERLSELAGTRAPSEKTTELVEGLLLAKAQFLASSTLGEVLDQCARAEARCDALVRSMLEVAVRRDLRDTVVDQLLTDRPQLPPYADDPTQDGLAVVS